ncbi:MAG: four helix bundle protein [Saprospiraceae bacterium]|nr:four helix bundle protein [Saprospiraceae bacterium]
MKTQTYNLEERLINFAVSTIQVISLLPNSSMGKHLSGQLGRLGTSPALNYGEAQGAESPADFLHKLRICLKELRESQITLKIAQRSGLLKEVAVAPILNECNQLVAIFTSSVKTAQGKARPSK